MVSLRIAGRFDERSKLIVAPFCRSIRFAANRWSRSSRRAGAFRGARPRTIMRSGKTERMDSYPLHPRPAIEDDGEFWVLLNGEIDHAQANRSARGAGVAVGLFFFELGVALAAR